MYETLLIASALVLIIEGLLPFAAPKLYRQGVARMAAMDDKSLRITGFFLMFVGLVLLYNLK